MQGLEAFDLSLDVLPKFVGRMRGWVWEGYHLDIGTHQALNRARRDAMATFRNWHSAKKRDGAYRKSDQFIVK
jgi:hypothetical protein